MWKSWIVRKRRTTDENEEEDYEYLQGCRCSWYPGCNVFDINVVVIIIIIIVVVVIINIIINIILKDSLRGVGIGVVQCYLLIVIGLGGI